MIVLAVQVSERLPVLPYLVYIATNRAYIVAYNVVD